MDVLHHQVQVPGVGERRLQLDDSLTVGVGHQVAFISDVLKLVFFSHQQLGQLLYRHNFAGQLVSTHSHLPERPAPNDLYRFIVAYLLTHSLFAEVFHLPLHYILDQLILLLLTEFEFFNGV